MHRRTFLAHALAGTWVLAIGSGPARAGGRSDAAVRLAALERRHGGRLGVAMLDTGSGRRVIHRGDERFLLCSTFKALLVAAVLARVDRGEERLDRRVVFGPGAVLSYAPVTSRHAGGPGMRVDALCEAAITVSDNTAANLLLASLGGPAAVTRFVRGLGDPVTRLDRIEPALNLGSPGDRRDTTTPNAMLDTLRTLLLGNALEQSSRQRLAGWMRACSTGAAQLRAGIPAGWVVGDKTGSGRHGETNDVAVVWPPHRKPLLVTAYYADSPADLDTRKAVLAEVGNISAGL